MPLINKVLKGIIDTDPLAKYIDISEPLRNLYDRHNSIAAHDFSIHKLTPESTGLDLKNALDDHVPDTQIELLYAYISEVKLAGFNIEDTGMYHVYNPKVADPESAKNVDAIVEEKVSAALNKHEEKKSTGGLVLSIFLLCLTIFIFFVLSKNRILNINMESITKLFDYVIELTKVIFG